MFALHVPRLYIIPIIAKLIAATGFYLFTGFRGVINRTPSSDKHHSVVTRLMSHRLTRTGDDRKQVQQVQDLVCTVTTPSKSTCTPRSTVHADHGWFWNGPQTQIQLCSRHRQHSAVRESIPKLYCGGYTCTSSPFLLHPHPPPASAALHQFEFAGNLTL